MIKDEININPKFKKTQLNVIKELYNFKEDISNKILLLNEPYVNEINDNLLIVKDKLTEVYNLLIPLCQYHEDMKNEDNLYRS